MNEKVLLEKIRQIVREEVSANNNTPDEFMTGEQLAKHLNVSEKTLVTWRSRGKGPAYCRAGGIKYRVKDVNTWIESRIVP